MITLAIIAACTITAFIVWSWGAVAKRADEQAETDYQLLMAAHIRSRRIEHGGE